jgi:hypothetical protein
MLLLLFGADASSVADRMLYHTVAALQFAGSIGIFRALPMCAPSDENLQMYCAFLLYVRVTRNKGRFTEVRWPQGRNAWLMGWTVDRETMDNHFAGLCDFV